MKKTSSAFTGFSLFLSALLLSACSLAPQQRVLFEGEAGTVIFSGNMDGDVPTKGRLVFNANGSEFDGRFDGNGFPREGVLRQRYRDSNGEWLNLSLAGRFRFNAETQQLRFVGEFTLKDSEQRLLAQGRDSQWLNHYPDTVFRVAPAQFVLDGKQQYWQYRRDISPANAPRRFVRIYRPLPGPFLVKVRYEEGLPRGVAQIRRELADGQRYVIERQYFNYALADQRSHYYYFEPGSFEGISIIGDCLAPNLTVPQQLISVYAFDCEQGRFFALSEKLPASVLSIDSSQIDNSGRFHKLRILHHGSTTEFDVDVEALLHGELRAHGVYKDWHYGQLRAAYHADQGRPVGIGIVRASADQAKYAMHRSDQPQGVRPEPAHYATLRGVSADRAQQVEEVFKKHAQGRLNTRRAKALQSALVALYEHPVPQELAKYPGAISLYQRWQTESLALVERWSWGTRRSAKDMATLRRALLAKQAHYADQLPDYLQVQASAYCRSRGESFDSVAWQCHRQPSATIKEICQRAYGIQRCEAMQQELNKERASSAVQED